MIINSFELIPTSLYPEFDIKITLKPSYRCNQNCWFCEEYDNDSSDWNQEQTDNVLEFINKIFKLNTGKKFFIYLYGGEPTLSKEWERIQKSIFKNNPTEEIFIQTQTNLSINRRRLRTFLEEIREVQSAKHKIDICSSYHLKKQRKDIFLEKMNICAEYGVLGLCFFNTDFLDEDQFIEEFNYIADHHPNTVKLRFTEVGKGVEDTVEGSKYPRDQGGIKSFEFRYFMNKYPHFKDFFEDGFNFNVNGSKMNFSEVSANDIHKKFRHMKCEAGTKNLVIDNNLMTYQCNDDFKNKILFTKLDELIPEELFKKLKYCLNKECYDGLEFNKSR